MRLLAITLAFALILGLNACGTKGPLVPPPLPTAAAQPAPAPAADDSKAAKGAAQ